MPKKLTPALAAQLERETKRAAELEAQAKQAAEDRDKTRAKVKPLLSPATDPEDAKKGVLEGAAGGVTIRLFPQVSAETFSIKGYRDAGHKITAAMRGFLGGKTPYESTRGWKSTWPELSSPP